MNRPFHDYCVLSSLDFEWKVMQELTLFQQEPPCFSYVNDAVVILISKNNNWFIWDKLWGLYQNKVNSRLTFLQRSSN